MISIVFFFYLIQVQPITTLIQGIKLACAVIWLFMDPVQEAKIVPLPILWLRLRHTETKINEQQSSQL